MGIAADVPTGTVIGRLVRSTFLGPNGIPLAHAQVVFTANVKSSRHGAAVPPVTVFVDPVIASTDADGILISAPDTPGVILAATGNPLSDPQIASYSVSVIAPTITRQTWNILVPTGETVDLTTAERIPASPSTEIAEWIQVRDEARTARDEAVAAAGEVPGLVADALETVVGTGGLVDQAEDARDIAVAAAASATAPTDGMVAEKISDPSSLTADALSTNIGEAVDTVGTPVRNSIEKMRVAPSLAPITERMEPLRIAVIQEPGAVYSVWSRVGEVPKFEKSTDGGTSWTSLSTMPGVPNSFIKLSSGTILAVQEKVTTTPGGSKPLVWRSVNDGVTWAEVPANLNFGPLSSQGICEGTDGSVMIAEYGNIGNFSYRIRRSTNDGLTWTTVFASSGLEAQGDPGHIHSVTYDHVAGRHVFFSDRPMVTGVSGPQIYSSSDDGATWDLIGESDHVDKPNFVSPMYFSEYIAWGSDNHINGRISRIKRDDFYAGRFHLTETVAQLSQKALYFTFPLRPDVWAVSMAGEHINSPLQSGGGGSTMNEVWLVSDNGALVSGGMESYRVTTPPGELSGVRPSFPARGYNRVDHKGFMWANMPIGAPRAYAAIPTTQGWEPSSKRIDNRAMPLIPPRVPLQLQKTSMDPTDVIRFIEYTGSLVAVTNSTAGNVSERAEIRFLNSGAIDFASGNKVIASIPAAGGAMRFHGERVDLATNGIGFRVGSGSPEGVVEAPVGSIYLNYTGGRGISAWIKEQGTSTTSTGWSPIGHTSGPTYSRPSPTVAGAAYFDTQLNKPIWRNASNSGWIDAAGADV